MWNPLTRGRGSDPRAATFDPRCQSRDRERVPQDFSYSRLLSEEYCG